MKYRFYDIVAERDSDFQEYAVNQEYVLDMPDHDLSTAVERQEYLGIMFETLTQASGYNISSFKCDEVSC